MSGTSMDGTCAVISMDAFWRMSRLAMKGTREAYDAAEAAGDRETCERLAREAGAPLDVPRVVDVDTTGTGFKFTRMGDVLAAGLKPIQWLVRDYVEADSLAVLFGDPAAGKSFVAIDMACSIATGTPWQGRNTELGAVFYIAGEGQNGLARRFAAWSQYHGITLADAPLFTSSRPAMLCTPDGAVEVATAAEAIAEETGVSPALIVVDTLARNFGGNESDAEDMSAFVFNLDKYFRQSGRWNATVLVVHHSGHAEKMRGRGSSVLKAAIDAEYSATKGEDGLVRIETTKMKDAQEPKPVAFKMQVVELEQDGVPMLDDAGEPVTSVVLRGTEYVPPVKSGKAGRGKNQTLALAVLKELAAASRDGEVADAAWRSAMEAKGIGRTRFYEIRQSLLDARSVFTGSPGHVRVEDDDGPL